ncbi:MAG: acyltransferase, partial [Anaerolineales bacterium]
AEDQRVERLKQTLASCGEDVTIRPGARVVAPQHIHLGNHIGIGHYCMLNGNGGIRLGNFVLLADHVVLASSSHPVEEVRFHNTFEAPISIAENAWLGAGAIILPGVSIGENAVVAAGAVVRDDVPDHTIVGGVPARPVRTLELSPDALAEQKRAIRAQRIQRAGLSSQVEDIFAANKHEE